MLMNWIRRTLCPQMRFLLIVLLPLFIAGGGAVFRLVDGGKRPIHITDDLDDILDDEEDDAWREWGKKTSKPDLKFDPPPTDFQNLDLSDIQAQMLQRQLGPVFGFVKLHLGVKRTQNMVTEIAMKWTKVSRTGSLEVKFMAVDISTIMFTMEKGLDTLELKEFLLSQPEAYEIKIGDQLFRRPGDPPLEEVFEKLHGESDEPNHANPLEGISSQKEEL